jgi:membrane-bound lytic murein transglycosylase D
MTTFLNNYNMLPENERFAPQHTVHRVKRNESLWTISRKYGVSIHDLAAVNKIKNRNKIKMGQKLTIPIRGSKVRYTANKKTGPNGHAKKVYTVKKGDTLGHIAESHKTRARNIRRWNGLEYGGLIYPGQKLILWIKQG